MVRALLITNLVAARTTPSAVYAVSGLLRYSGWSVEVAETRGPGDARRLAESAVSDRFDVVIVFGGDGTTMQAAAALVGTDVALGVIPGGTGNLLAGNLRIPASPVRAAEALAHGRRRRLDLGRVERPEGTQYFAVACGAGMDARVMAQTSSDQKRKWGIGAYVATVLRLIPEVRRVPHTITIDGVTIDTGATVVLVANCREVIPPIVRLHQDISPEDGWLDVVIAGAGNLWESARTMYQFMREIPDASDGPRHLWYARGREITVTSDPQQPLEIDGESGWTTPFTASVVPAAIDVMVPTG